MKYKGPDIDAPARPWNPEVYSGWRRSVDAFVTRHGVRPALIHVPEGSWVRRFVANEDAFSAVVGELEKVDA